MQESHEETAALDIVVSRYCRPRCASVCSSLPAPSQKPPSFHKNPSGSFGFLNEPPWPSSCCRPPGQDEVVWLRCNNPWCSTDSLCHTVDICSATLGNSALLCHNCLPVASQMRVLIRSKAWQSMLYEEPDAGLVRVPGIHIFLILE